MSVEVRYRADLTVKETLTTGVSAASSDAVITHDGYNTSDYLTSSSTPQATKVAAFSAALADGSGSIDLSALTGTNGATVDLTGLKVQALKVRAPAANTEAITITEGETNGYALLGDSFTLDLLPGQEVLIYGNDATPDVGSAAKTLDLTGDGTETLEIIVVAG